MSTNQILLVTFYREDSHIIAAFLLEKWAGLIQCYTHNENLVMANLNYLSELRKADPDDYQPLLKELNQLGYQVQVQQ